MRLPHPPVLVALAILAACSGKPGSAVAHHGDADQPAAAQAMRPVATIRDLMESTVDPAADGVWDAVSTIVDAHGITRHAPRTDAQWQAVRHHAVTLAESMNLLMIGGRHAAPTGTKAGLGELPPVQIDARIAANRAEYDLFARAVQDEARKAIAAIDRHDAQALDHIGGDLDARCESCHVTFWYPDAPRPGA